MRESCPRIHAVVVCLVCWSIAVPALAQFVASPGISPLSLQSMRVGFANPPASARLRCYWWWLNGNTNEATITHDLEEMKAKGFGGALLVDAGGASQNGNEPVPAGPTFGSPAWVKLFTHALKEADRLGLEITFNITSGWNLGGPDVTPAQASKLLTYTRTPVTGGMRIHIPLPMPVIRNGYYQQIAILAYPLQHGQALAPQPDDGNGNQHTLGKGTGKQTAQSDHSDRILQYRSAAAEAGFSMPDTAAMLNDGASEFGGDTSYADTTLAKVRDVSAQVNADGTLDWQAPAGNWEVLRIGYTDAGARVSTASGAWQGLAIDYLSRAAFEQYWDQTVEPLLSAAKPYRSLKYLATDSWELGGTNWTPKFREQFIQLRGYDPTPWLPVVAGRIVGDRDRSTRFLTDLRRTVADLVVSQHYDVFAEKAREHGMGVEAESGGPHGAPLDALETFRHAAVPQTEFWSQNAHRSTDSERFFTKEAASAANIYGQRLVAEEGETSIGPQWSESLATDLKPTFDMGITEGMNRMVWHEFTSSPANTGLPGQEYFAGTHLNPKVTWWNAGAAFFQYLNRAQFLMQQGNAVDDVLYFYGDNVPAFVRRKADDPGHVLPGYDYDVTDEDALLHAIRIEGPELEGPSGVRWRLLALPRTRRDSVDVIRLVERYVSQGGTVVGLPPTSVTGNISQAQQAEFSALVSKIWSGCSAGSSHMYERGHVYCTQDSHAVLAQMGVPEDFTSETADGTAIDGKPYASSSTGLDYVHRRSGNTDIYFLRNASAVPVVFHAAFRVGREQCEVWDGVDGSIRSVASTKAADSRSVVALSLPAFGSTYVVFSGAIKSSPPRPALTEKSFPLRTKEDWALSFQPDRGAPAAPVKLTALQSWTQSGQAGVRYFSGTAIYSADVQAPAVSKDAAIYLRFTDVREIARVRVNARDAGTVWAMPYNLRVDKLLRPGLNHLEIAVTNLWPNRIIGDRQPGNVRRYTHTNITTYKADSPLLPSGLIGPIEWVIEQ